MNKHKIEIDIPEGMEIEKVGIELDGDKQVLVPTFRKKDPQYPAMGEHLCALIFRNRKFETVDTIWEGSYSDRLCFDMGDYLSPEDGQAAVEKLNNAIKDVQW